MTALLAASFITVAALFLYQVLSFKVGMARGKYGIQAPAVTGHPDFERIYRVQMNTLEQLVFFIPALWLFAVHVGHAQALGVLGVIWLAGRILYARAYYRDAAKRSAGFIMALLSANILLVWALMMMFIDPLA